MLFEQSDFIASVSRLVRRQTNDPALHDDLLQEIIIWLCKLESDERPKTKNHSWYLKRCRYFLLDWFKAGRSLDSPKRRHLGCEIQTDPADDTAGEHLSAPTETFQEVSFRDIFNVLWNHVPPADREVLQLLAQGFGDTDIAEALALDRSSISRRRRRIANTAISLGISLYPG